MKIIEDTRNKPGKHTLKNKYWQERGIDVLRSKLAFGDYSVIPERAVDTKENMEEIANNIGGPRNEHIRFREECKRAQHFGCKLYFLIENEEGIRCIEDVANWKNPRRYFSPKAIDGKRLCKAMHTIQERYGCEFHFCSPEEAGAYVLRLLGGNNEQ